LNTSTSSGVDISIPQLFTFVALIVLKFNYADKIVLQRLTPDVFFVFTVSVHMT